MRPTVPPPPSDADLDVYIRTRYALLGIDISVLPVKDEAAPMGQARLLENGREILRKDAEAADVVIDGQFHVPMPFVPQFRAWRGEEDA